MHAETVPITGGAGFIGVNAAEAFIRDGWRVIVFDSLSRKGAELNLRRRWNLPEGSDLDEC